jgi:hypothetical protein
MSFRKKFIPFTHLPRRKRRELYIRLRWRIRRTAATYGGDFTNHQVLTEPGRPSLFNQWADVYFCGGDGITIWNAEVITTTCAFWDKVDDLAHTRAWGMLTAAEQEQEVKFEFKPVWVGGRKCFEMVQREEICYPQFGGLTYHNYLDQLADEIIQSDPPPVVEEFVTDSAYRYGIGLHMVINVDEINISTIEQSIHRFRAGGETDWRAESPVSRKDLPTESQRAAYSRL